MAEKEGFEPSVRINVHTLSRRAPSATRTLLHKARDFIVNGDDMQLLCCVEPPNLLDNIRFMHQPPIF